MKCMNQCDYPSDDGGPCRCAQDAAKMQVLDKDKLLMHSEYRVVPRSIDAGHGWSYPDEYEVKNDVHLACQLQNETEALNLAARLNELRSMKLAAKLERQLKEINGG